MERCEGKKTQKNMSVFFLQKVHAYSDSSTATFKTNTFASRRLNGFKVGRPLALVPAWLDTSTADFHLLCSFSTGGPLSASVN